MDYFSLTELLFHGNKYATEKKGAIKKNTLLSLWGKGTSRPTAEKNGSDSDITKLKTGIVIMAMLWAVRLLQRCLAPGLGVLKQLEVLVLPEVNM